jgi:hypothetical protein
LRFVALIATDDPTLPEAGSVSTELERESVAEAITVLPDSKLMKYCGTEIPPTFAGRSGTGIFSAEFSAEQDVVEELKQTV